MLGAASCDWPTLTLAPGEGLVGSRGQNVHRMSPLDPEVAEAVEAWGKDDVAWKGAWQQPQQGQQGMQGKRAHRPDVSKFSNRLYYCEHNRFCNRSNNSNIPSQPLTAVQRDFVVELFQGIWA